MNLSAKQKEMIRSLRELDASAKKGPWYEGGKTSKNGRIYTMKPAEEKLVIAMRNHITELLDIIDNN